MAYIIPSDISQLALSGAHSGELETLQVLKQRLPSSFTVFHGVHWTRDHGSRTGFGEIDFIVLNKDGKILLIEQKNGALGETDKGLVKQYENGPKNVPTQILRNLEGIRRKFEWQNSRSPKLELDYLLFCPDYRVTNLNAAGLDKSRIVDSTRKTDLADVIETILGEGSGDDPDREQKLREFFRQSFEVVPDVHAHISETERTFTRLSSNLANILENIEMTPLRLRVKGAAGCGKSGVAIKFYEDVLRKGRRPLLVCFNKPLREKINAIVPEGGLVQTWYGLCATFLQERGHTLDFSEMRKNPKFWDEVLEQVIAEEIPDTWKFDSLIIDEAQDFETEWFEILNLFLSEDHDVLWLEDEAQNIRRTSPSDTGEFVVYRATQNYRSTESIARFIQKTLPFEFECANPLQGMGVGVTTYGNSDEQPKLAGKILGELMARGFSPSDIVVLTMRGHENSIISGRKRLGNYTLSRFAGEYDLFGNQLISSGQIHFDSVRRFKGQQASAVIVIDVDPDDEQYEQWSRLLYCAMTRATVRLELIANRQNSRTASLFPN